MRGATTAKSRQIAWAMTPHLSRSDERRAGKTNGRQIGLGGPIWWTTLSPVGTAWAVGSDGLTDFERWPHRKYGATFAAIILNSGSVNGTVVLKVVQD